jgi:hypothetical protein
MKQVIFLFGLMLLVLTQACAQKTAPKLVENAFSEKFPTAKNVKWDKENEKEWEAEFKMNGKEFSANFLTDGTWQETEHEISKNEIPVAVKKVLDTDFEGFKIEEAEISETTNGKVYEVLIEKGETTKEVVFSEEGKIISKKLEVEKDDKD